MVEIQLLRRIDEAISPVNGKELNSKPLWPISGKMHPNVCPAIKEANNKGLFLSSTYEIEFDGPSNFNVLLGLNNQREVFVLPGIIGSPDSTILFAKVDTGFSVENLPVDLLSTPVLDIEFSLNLIVPGVMYPKGYSGPIFIAVASRTKTSVPVGYPLAQFIVLSEEVAYISISEGLEKSSQDKRFEGLLQPGWQSFRENGLLVKANECLELFRLYPEGVLSTMLGMNPIKEGLKK